MFYPRYLEMFNNLVEDWFRDGLKLPFADLINERGWGIPTVHINVDFVAPSRIGEVLTASLWVRKLGRSSIHMAIVLSGPDGRDRVTSKEVLVFTDLGTGRARAIPEHLFAKLSEFKVVEEKSHADSSTA